MSFDFHEIFRVYTKLINLNNALKCMSKPISIQKIYNLGDAFSKSSSVFYGKVKFCNICFSVGKSEKSGLF